MKQRRITKRILTFLLAFSIVFSCLGSGNYTVVRAAGNTMVLNENATMEIVSAIDKKTGENLLEGNKTVTHGDSLLFEMKWAFDDDLKFTTADTFTYQLPKEITFTNVENRPVMNKNTEIGKYSIVNNVISIRYTDENFCARDNTRSGQLTFSGNIWSAPNPDKPEDDVKISFPDAVEFTIHTVPRPVETELKIDKRFTNSRQRPSDDIYECIIAIEAVNDNTDLDFYDSMYPGMSLCSDVKVYSDSACTVYHSVATITE